LAEEARPLNAQVALRTFLAGALIRRRDRYLGFVAKRKNHVKFLGTIYHELERDLDKARQIAAFPAGDVPIPGYRFAPPEEFGAPVGDIREVCASSEDSFLVVSEDGQYGVHGPETYIDDRAIYHVETG
jgi:hypothetical protein